MAELSFVKYVVMACLVLLVYWRMFRTPKDLPATMWSDGLYCQHLDAWYYGSWMSGRFRVESVVVRKQGIFTWKLITVFKKTNSGLELLGFAWRITKQYYHYTQAAHA